MRRSIIVLWALWLTACLPSDSVDDDLRRGELAVRSLIAAWERADTALIADLFLPQATYDDFPNQITYQGVAEIVGYLTAAHRWGDDVFVSVGNVLATDNGAVAEWVFSAVQVRPLGDAVPTGTGREVVLNGATVIEMQGDRIIRAADYADAVPLWLQLGGRIELPGGAVLDLESGR